MDFFRKFALSTFSFSLVIAIVLGLHVANYNVWVPSVYHFNSYAVNAGYLALDPISVANVVTLLFLSSFLFFGAIAPIACAYVAAQLMSAMVAGAVSPGEFFIIIPCALALYSGLMLSSGLSNDFHHKGILYSELRSGLLVFGLAVAVTAIYIAFRLQFLAG